MLAFLSYVPCARYHANDRFTDCLLKSFPHPSEEGPIIVFDR